MRSATPPAFLSPGQAHDFDGAEALLADHAAATLIADKAYDAEDRVIGPSHTPARTS